MLGSSIQPAWERGSADSRPAGLSHRRHRDRIPLPPILAGIPELAPRGASRKHLFSMTSSLSLPRRHQWRCRQHSCRGKRRTRMEKTPCGLCNRHGALEGIDAIKTCFLYFLVFIHMACTVPEAPRE